MSVVDGTSNVDDRVSDADASVDQLDGGHGFGTRHFGSSVRTRAGCVEQVWARILEAGGYSRAGRQAGRQAGRPLIRKTNAVLAGPRLTWALAHASELHVDILGWGWGWG